MMRQRVCRGTMEIIDDPTYRSKTATSLRSGDDDEAEATVVMSAGVGVTAGAARDFVAAAPTVGAAAVGAGHMPDAPLRALFVRKWRAGDRDALIEFVRDGAEFSTVRRDAATVAPACRPVRELMLQHEQRL